jgi:hypothetical protein
MYRATPGARRPWTRATTFDMTLRLGRLLTSPVRRRGWSPPKTADRLMTPTARTDGGSPPMLRPLRSQRPACPTYRAVVAMMAAADP